MIKIKLKNKEKKIEIVAKKIDRHRWWELTEK